MNIRLLIRFSTQPGQTLHVSGSIPQLGSWQESAARPMHFLNMEFWEAAFEVDSASVDLLEYHYILLDKSGEVTTEWGKDRRIEVSRISGNSIESIDTWNPAGAIENVLFTAPFRSVFMPTPVATTGKPQSYRHFSHLFQVKAPLLKDAEAVCILGNKSLLGNWDIQQAMLLQKEGDWWSIRLDLSAESGPLEYKYGIMDVNTGKFLAYEEGKNRSVPFDSEKGAFRILRDGFVRMDNTSWKGCGVAIPVFSLRSENGSGVGEFRDIKALADWSNAVGIKLIQILPVNDTTSTHTWVDSYPYSAISAFALHPMFINLEELAGEQFKQLLQPHLKRKKALNLLPDMDYEGVMRYKMPILEELYEQRKDETFSSQAYAEFFEQNNDWLIPYAAFCFLRDKFRTADFSQWKKQAVYNEREIGELTSPTSKQYNKIAFHYFLQFHLHLQLQDAHDYANQQGLIVKGDIPIGVNRHGVDAWVAPDLYNMDMQAGAPPDDFAVKGQNWGFPTYNWMRMKRDNFAWWKRRFEQMSRYFDAFRIDHILGFFRIWSIPEHAVEGIMGRFVPAFPVVGSEFEQLGLFLDTHRFCSPFITDTVLWDMFGPEEKKVKPFLDSTGTGHYQLKRDFDNQRKLERFFADKEENEDNLRLRQWLYDLLSNVILFKEHHPQGDVFHFRFNMESTSSFRYLDHDTRHKLKELYIDYFFRRQDLHWKKEAMEKLPALKRASNMLICGEDLGLVPSCVPDVMQQLGFLSLEIQRMPKNPARTFSHIPDSPYLSVVTPSTHDMSTIRGWWEEDRSRTQRFFNDELGQYGEAPVSCEAWINKTILLQHLYAPSMWAVFQLQDILGMDEQLRRPNPQDERINVPANPRHYWRYRMHLSLEQLQKLGAFNDVFRNMITASGRI